MKFPPTKLKAVFAVAFRLLKELLAITIPGEVALPRTKLRLLLPNVKVALP